MALSLGVRKGSLIKVGGEVVREGRRIIGVHGGTLLTVEDVHEHTVIVGVAGRSYTVTPHDWTELMPNVKASTGRALSQSSHESEGYARITFEAPRTIAINRIPNA